MATAKKSSPKKSSAKSKSSATKKTPSKKAPVKKNVNKKVAPRKKPEYDSFHLSAEKTPFFTYKVTDQTIYWLVLSVVVFVLALWVLHLHLEVVRISAGIV